MTQIFIPKNGAKTARKKKTKYGNTKVKFQGKKFDSIIERDRYIFLKDAEKRGIVRNLRCQVSFALDVEGMLVCRYIADFVYEKIYTYGDDAGVSEITFDKSGKFCWCCVVEDVKGMSTAMFKLKAKLMLAVLGIEVVIVKIPTEPL